ncbi:hypothetical protein [Paenibacillus sp. HB172176]|uniref:hypothetical protein n=1 Tax=Paenibacillus sp. HB172176 TaxID=2493690 RepID=UPI0014399F63|nr:hypothetical protein [Paenibacillus sp. HB172176]
MKKWIYGSSFKRRIWLSLVLFTVTAILISGGTSYYIASAIMGRKMNSLNQMVVNKSAQALEEKLRKVRLAVLTFMSSEPFQDVISNSGSEGDASAYEHFKTNKLLQTPIFQMRLIEPAIQSIIIDTPGGEYYGASYERLTQFPLKDSELYKHMEGRKLPAWIQAHEDPFFSGNEKVVSLLLSPLSQKDVNVLVNVRESNLNNYLLADKDEGSGDFIVYNENGELAFTGQ